MKHEPIIEFLLGSGELDGVWFGDHPHGKGAFWWRTALREYAERMAALFLNGISLLLTFV